jgi:hypothetical protein
MLWMTALIQNIQFGLFGGHDRNENLVIVVALAEVSTESALSCMNRLHRNLLTFFRVVNELSTLP